MKVLFTGATGQLGHYLAEQGAELFPETELIGMSRAELDLGDDESIRNAISQHRPDVVINAAGYTNVDGAEDEAEKSMRLNGAAVGVLAKSCEGVDARLIQISTDYVFDGEATEPYQPDAPTNPLGVYGRTKLEGERQALDHSEHSLVLRTSWVYSEVGTNFANTMRRLFRERDEISVVEDQIGCPTHARDLAAHGLELAHASDWKERMFHFRGPDVMSWYDLACRLLRESPELSCQIHPIPTSAYPTKAKRPLYSVLACS